jgi:hypothetical protein
MLLLVAFYALQGVVVVTRLREPIYERTVTTTLSI